MSEMEIKGLPGGWAAVSLSEIVEPRSGKALPSKTPDAKFIGMEHVEAHTMRLLGTVPASEMKSAANVFQKGDVLYGRLRSYLNKVYQPEFCGLCSGEFIVLPESPEVSGSFLKYRLNAMDFVAFASHINTGDRPRVDFDQIKAFQFLLPPIREQQRISDALDELLSDLDAGVEALQRAQAKLALYRASVLKAAVQGDLTAEWRKQHPDTEPASALLQRILTERRQRWEQEQLRKFKAAGKTPPANWKAKYKEPVAPDTTNLPELPKGWCWATVDQVCEVGTGATPNRGQRARYYDGGSIPWVTSSCVNLSFVDHPSELVTENALEECNLTVYPPGALLLAMYGEGKTRGMHTQLRIHAATNQALAALQMASNIRSYLRLFLAKNYQDVRRSASGGVQPNLNLDVVRSIALPLPPQHEQNAIVECAEDQLSVIEHIETDIDSKLATANALRQSILRHAFTGQLVPQDPNDEPASELLKRIAAEREARKKTKATPRKQTAKRQKREK